MTGENNFVEFIVAVGVFDPPQQLILFDRDGSDEIDYHIGDVVLHVSSGRNYITGSELRTVDPFTGSQETFVGYFGGPFTTRDIATNPLNPDFEKFAAAYDTAYFNVDKMEGIAGAMAAALKAQRPAIVEIDATAL